jgi:sensor domain CHASE-containing protein/nitrogen-specific signal transduction histidine kinase
MDLRKKALWGFVGAVIITMIILASLSFFFIRGNYLNLESSYLRSDVNLVSKNIDGEVKNLKSNTPDWGAWDDTYAFVLGEKPEYVSVNLVNTTFRTLRANFIIITDREGRIRYGEGYDLVSDTPVPLRPDLVAELGKGRILAQTTGGTDGVAGFLSLPGGPIILSSYPVLHSDYTGPALGMVIIGRNVDDTEIELLTQGTTPGLSIRPFDPSTILPDDLALLTGTGDTAIVVHALDENVVEGKKVLRDIYGRDTLLLTVQLPRDIYHEGNQTIFIFILLQFGIVLVLGITGMVVLDRTVLARMSAISADITGITENTDPAARIKTAGNDELSRLAGVINTLLDKIEQNQVQLAAAYKSASEANRKLNLLTGITRHDILNQIMVTRGFLTVIQKKITDPELLEVLKKIESSTVAIQSQIEFTRVYQDLGTHEPQWIELDTVIPRNRVLAPITLNADVQGVRVFADPMLEKVFFNLLDNSVRHGQRVTGIRVSSHQSGKDLVIVWEDNGVGIPADEKERIFERGFGKNTGLGMFLAREILSLTGITISETGTPGTGARFEILVPEGAYRMPVG